MNTTPHNFGGLEKEFSDYRRAKIAILPVPFDKTTTWLKGSDKGPKAIIEASRNMELYDITTDSEVYKQGIFTAKPVLANNSETMVVKVYQATKKLLADKKFVATLGGEHSISEGVIKAHSEVFKNMNVLHLDAHSDQRESYEGNKHSHACAMARAKDFVSKVVSVGIRSMDSSELKNVDQKNIFYAEKIRFTCLAEAPAKRVGGQETPWIKEVVNELSDNVYLSLDLDVFDPAIMPSTGTPEPGGLWWYQVLDLIAMVAKNKKIVGFDIVELRSDGNKASDFLAAKLVYKILSYIFKENANYR